MKPTDAKPQLSDLRALLALIQDGTVTSASARLGITQSTLSYQLDGMRKRFADPLFVRIGNRMAPTPFALKLAEPARRVLHIMDSDIANLAQFDPYTTERVFRIGVNEIGAIAMVPRLMHALSQRAPGARLMQVRVDVSTMAAQLDSGEMDIAAGHFPGTDSGLYQQLLYKRDYVCIAREGHPRVRDKMSWRALSEEWQLQCPTIPATNSWIDRQLQKAGLPSDRITTSQHVAAIPFIVGATDLVAVLPQEAYQLFRPVAKVRSFKLPRTIPPIAIHQYWHPRLVSDPAVRFFKDLIYSTVHED